MPQIDAFVVAWNFVQGLVKEFAAFTIELPYMRVVYREVELQIYVC